MESNPVDASTKNRAKVGPFARLFRAMWYAALSPAPPPGRPQGSPLPYTNRLAKAVYSRGGDVLDTSALYNPALGAVLGNCSFNV